MKKIDEYYVPWVKGIPMYISGHIELAWKKPELHRMMSNENPNPPSEKVLETIIKYAKMANRYPDQGLVIRGKIAKINGLDGAENVMLGNGSSEVYDNIFRVLRRPRRGSHPAHAVLRHLQAARAPSWAARWSRCQWSIRTSTCTTIADANP